MSFLFLGVSSGSYIVAMLLLVVTWMSFSTKELLARPALTGHPVIFWTLALPWIIIYLTASIVSGFKHTFYNVAFRVFLSTAAALFLVLSICAAYYGWNTVQRLKKASDQFARRQQMRAFVVMIIILTSVMVSSSLEAIFLTQIDKIRQLFLTIETMYLAYAVILSVGSGLYAWHGTTYYKKHSSDSHSTTVQTATRSKPASKLAVGAESAPPAEDGVVSSGSSKKQKRSSSLTVKHARKGKQAPSDSFEEKASPGSPV
jgi:membrane protein implicated in regulation of membrane protease activity